MNKNNSYTQVSNGLFYFLSCYLDENSFLKSQVAAIVFPKFWGQEALTEVCSGISTQSKTFTKAPTALAIGEAVSVVYYRKCIHYYLFTKEALARSKATDPNLGEFVSRD